MPSACSPEVLECATVLAKRIVTCYETFTARYAPAVVHPTFAHQYLTALVRALNHQLLPDLRLVLVAVGDDKLEIVCEWLQ